jgi:LysR family nitrogen assimilation transcriptional regulator
VALDKRQIEYFVAIARLGSFRRASELLHIAQPALTRQMKRLERGLGVALFQRQGRNIVVTEAGQLLLDRGQRLLEEFANTEADVAARANVPSGTVSIGAAPSIAHILFAQVAARYRELHPQVEVRLFEAISHLWSWLAEGKLDIAILPNCEPSPNLPFKVHQLVKEQIYLVGRGSDPRMPSVLCSPCDILKLPLVISSHPNTARNWLENYGDKVGSRPVIAVETDSLLLQRNLVAGGIGFALLPYCAIASFFGHQAMRAVPVEDLVLSRTLAWRADRPLSPAANGVIEIICEEARKAGAEGKFG